MSGQFTMYSTPWCGYCHRLKSQLDREGIEYDVVDIEQDPAAAELVMSVNGGDMRRVTNGISGYCAEPDWSRANPNKIAFTMLEGRRYQIAVLDLPSGKSDKVSNASFDGVEPSWLPDGRHLIYTARDQRTSYLCILDTETGASTSVSQGFGSSALQASVWTP